LSTSPNFSLASVPDLGKIFIRGVQVKPFRILALSLAGPALLCATTCRAQISPKQASGPQRSEIETAHARTSCDCHELEDAQTKIERLGTFLHDWPNLSRYRDLNRALPAPAPDENRVVFMGDSITDSWARPQFAPFFPGKPYLGRGIGGQTTPQMLVRFREDVIELQPKVVVILAGTNDLAGNTGPMSLEETEGNLASMAELAQAHGIRVVLSSVLPVFDGGVTQDGKTLIFSDHRPIEKILSLNAWIKKYAAEHKIVYLDYFSVMEDEQGFLKRDLSQDGLHPNKKGYDVMAPLAEKAIGDALKQAGTQ
jgi:lysophospholipase L1-like esterase